MRMAVATHEHKFDNGTSFTVFHSVFDEGISVLGSDLLKVRELIQTLYGGIFEQLYAEAQQDPTLYPNLLAPFPPLP
jgi:hypothetical protein